MFDRYFELLVFTKTNAESQEVKQTLGFDWLPDYCVVEVNDSVI